MVMVMVMVMVPVMVMVLLIGGIFPEPEASAVQDPGTFRRSGCGVARHGHGDLDVSGNGAKEGDTGPPWCVGQR
jgi:hypothetical protein